LPGQAAYKARTSRISPFPGPTAYIILCCCRIHRQLPSALYLPAPTLFRFVFSGEVASFAALRQSLVVSLRSLEISSLFIRRRERT
jgi:hypothetical protein